MAKLILGVAEFYQLHYEKEMESFLIDQSDDFKMTVENGRLLVNGEEKSHVWISYASVDVFETVDLSRFKTRSTKTNFPDCDLIEFDIDSNDIYARDVAFRVVNGLNMLELSKIQYHGKTYTGVVNSSKRKSDI